jgi:hypothetical protein
LLIHGDFVMGVVGFGVRGGGSVAS